jgi:hypothetical protein
MNSRERVLAAARREPTDRPPTGLRCTPEAWASLRRHLGVRTNDDVLDELDIDLRVTVHGVFFLTDLSAACRTA